MELDILNKLYLELSQVVTAVTEKELLLQKQITKLRNAIKPFARLILSTEGRIPYERLSAENWHTLVKAYKETALQSPGTQTQGQDDNG